MSDSADSLPQVTLKPRRALPFFSGHPWVFAGAIARTDGAPAVGAEVRVHAADGKFIARGLYNPDSNIRVRLYSWQRGTPIDTALFAERLDAAIDLRRRLFPDRPEWNACRLVYSEADGMSGLTLDRYGDHLLLQWTSRALALREAEIIPLLEERLHPAGIWRRTEKGIGEQEGLAVSDERIAGSEPPRPLFIEENGLRYGVDVVAGQKTGYYFDQRDNRAAAARYLSGRVLDVFCYTGAFGLNALKHGRTEQVLAVDSSETALNLARNNAELNSLADHIRFEHGSAAPTLERLHAAGERFDGIVLDPPKMARSRGGIDRALKGYRRLNQLAVGLLSPGGILVTCSCSGLVPRAAFEQMLAEVATESHRRIQILESRGAAADHPVSVQCIENDYLKCFICRVV
ncbi:MAG: class I SAM-dependent rRNA methyltransferase [Planctomycetaceae bacterium]|nr:class I SAM-dependent rRNA methyltransferase [Planctomycetaceae bacterium]